MYEYSSNSSILLLRLLEELLLLQRVIELFLIPNRCGFLLNNCKEFFFIIIQFVTILYNNWNILSGVLSRRHYIRLERRSKCSNSLLSHTSFLSSFPALRFLFLFQFHRTWISCSYFLILLRRGYLPQITWNCCRYHHSCWIRSHLK